MITTLQVVDEILPLTREDNNCGFRKAKKLRERANLIMLINDYREGKNVVLPNDVLKLLEDERRQAMEAI
jgi:GH35 family endo-1,4-beta-xylanase